MQIAELEAQVVGLKFDRSKWKSVRFDQMAQCVTDRVDNPSEAGVDRYVGLEHLDPHSLKLARWGSPSDVEATKLRFKPGDIIFGKRRAYQRKLAAADFEGICSAHAMVLRAKEDTVVPGYLPVFMQSECFFETALRISVGGLSPTINWRELARQEFLIPDKEDQHRITNMLWSVENLLRRQRQACDDFRLLSLAMKASHLAQPRTQRTIAELVRRGVLDAPQDGNHGELHPKASDYVQSGIPFLMANNIRNGVVDLEGCKFLSKALTDRLRIGFALPGDVLLTHKGTVGEVAILSTLTQPYAMLTPQVTYYRVLDRNRLEPEYLAVQLSSKAVREQMRSLASSGTRDYIGIKAQLGLKLSCPPIEEQHELLRQLREIENSRKELTEHVQRLTDLKPVLTRSIFGEPN